VTQGLCVMGKTTTNNIPENAADIISLNLQESMRSNNQRAARFLKVENPSNQG